MQRLEAGIVDFECAFHHRLKKGFVEWHKIVSRPKMIAKYNLKVFISRLDKAPKYIYRIGM